ncbi:putative short-chain dehydrogenases/reductase [Naematelia encephala]|uniref:Putative short-chain dehydrogenases/reductase n=1 Tax=Naematelia encephala TaxID=71784 RepID=A0A1Y2AX88_9TREE|nr:putative short-chain dehydrogenases/reductase [Naematelia encephala]
MVAQSAVLSSNSSLATSLPAGMVAVFVGATSGIGEYALKAFAQQAKSPKIYFVGRSKDAADRPMLCQQILAKEDSINLLFQTQGTMLMDKTSEGLSIPYVLPVTSRILFTLNLLPALQKATSLKRVVSIFAGGHEGAFDENEWAEYANKKPMKARAHLASMITMANNVMARQAPDVSFIHNYPGAVRTPFGKDAKGLMAAIRVVFNFVGYFAIKYLPPAECGALQLYGATSARYPPAAGEAMGVPLSDDVPVARGTDGQAGSGSYSSNFDCENVSLDVDNHLAEAKADGAEERMWAYIMGEIKQITGKAR